MILLSRRTKEAIKTALAMTITYGIALAMDWDKPYWAGFAVAFCSLSTIGQSFNKAAMRMFGTLVALSPSGDRIAVVKRLFEDDQELAVMPIGPGQTRSVPLGNLRLVFNLGSSGGSDVAHDKVQMAAEAAAVDTIGDDSR